MAKIKTKEELQANIEKAKNDIRQGENYVKQLLRQTSQLERKQRSHRLIERGALLESMIKEADAFTNEQIKKLLQTAFNNTAVRELAATMRMENAANSTAEDE